MVPVVRPSSDAEDRMRSKHVWGSFVVGLAVITGCASGDDNTYSGGSDLSAPAASSDAPKRPSAKVTTNEVEKGDIICKVVLKLPVVDAGDPEVNAAIAKTLATHDPEDTACEHLIRDETLEVSLDFDVRTNERGLLAMTIARQDLDQDDPSSKPDVEDTVDGLTFDLQTGKLLALKDVLTPAGAKAALDMCTASLAKNLAGMQARTVAEMKDEAMRKCQGGTSTNSLGFTVQKDGLHLQVDVSMSAVGFSEQIIPWATLKSGLAPGVVATWVAGISGIK
jgi:hypothetical protein